MNRGSNYEKRWAGNDQREGKPRGIILKTKRRENVKRTCPPISNTPDRSVGAFCAPKHLPKTLLCLNTVCLPVSLIQGQQDLQGQGLVVSVFPGSKICPVTWATESSFSEVVGVDFWLELMAEEEFKMWLNLNYPHWGNRTGMWVKHRKRGKLKSYTWLWTQTP